MIRLGLCILGRKTHRDKVSFSLHPISSVYCQHGMPFFLAALGLVAAWRLSLVAEHGGSSCFFVQASYCGGFSCEAQALGRAGSSSCSTRACSCCSWP